MAEFKMKDFDLTGKIAWITGASYGIGFAIAKAYAAAGAKIVFNDRGQEQLDNGLKNYKEAGITDVHGYICDVTIEEQVQETVKKIEKDVGVVDILVNNAGITNNSNWIDITHEAYERVIGTNLMSALHMTHLVLPHMINHSSKDSQCVIVNTSSVGGMTGVINQADYCASKSGLIGLTRALALEFAGRGVRVNAIAPGMIMTDMLRGVNQDELNALAATIPEGYIGDVSDIAGALAYILTAPYLTGQIISPNGGFVLQ